jgi:uncharacterized protein (TIGR03437 family)
MPRRKWSSESTLKFVQLTVSIIAALGIAQAQTVNISGNWNFRGASSLSGQQFSGAGEITQLGANFVGLLTVSGSPCSSGSEIVNGSASGDSLNFDVEDDPSWSLVFTGIASADGTSASGTYTSPMVGCTGGDMGTWTAQRIPPATTGTNSTQPTIAAVTDGANFTMFPSPYGYVSFFGEDLSDGVYSASSAAYPTQLGNTQLFLCPTAVVSSSCTPLELAYVSPKQVNAVLPEFVGLVEAILNVYVIAQVNGTNSNAFQFTVYPWGPAIFVEGYDCSIDSRDPMAGIGCGLSSDPSHPEVRGAITDTSGNVLWSGNLARLGSFYTIWLTGLGYFSNVSMATSVYPNGEPPGMVEVYLSNFPAADSAVGTTVAATYIGPSPVYLGLDQINFQLPANLPLPCGTYNVEMNLSVTENCYDCLLFLQSIPVQIPVAVHPGDISGCGQQ